MVALVSVLNLSGFCMVVFFNFLETPIPIISFPNFVYSHFTDATFLYRARIATKKRLTEGCFELYNNYILTGCHFFICYSHTLYDWTARVICQGNGRM